MSETLEDIVVDVSKMETTAPTREKSSAVGNAAKMLEALQKIVLLTVKAGMSIRFDVACGIIASTARCALSSPPRNCDVGTAEEQKDRLEAFCAIHFRYSADNPCSGCPAYNGDSMPCVYRFLQMPYEEVGSK